MEGLNVSILTRPYGRMLWLPGKDGFAVYGCFNPHPPLRADAITWGLHPQ